MKDGYVYRVIEGTSALRMEDTRQADIINLRLARNTYPNARASSLPSRVRNGFKASSQTRAGSFMDSFIIGCVLSSVILIVSTFILLSL